MVELLTEQQFAHYSGLGGVIVIHDDSNHPGSKRVAHLQTKRKACSHVYVEDFRLKVLVNAQRNGRYWWARNSKVAERELQATLCAESKRLLGRT